MLHTKCDRSCGPMDKASDYESGDCRFESCQDQHFYSPRKTIIRNGYFWCDDSNHICNNFMFYNSQSIFGKAENGRKPENPSKLQLMLKGSLVLLG